jgi:hypothetical protein
MGDAAWSVMPWLVVYAIALILAACTGGLVAAGVLLLRGLKRGAL